MTNNLPFTVTLSSGAGYLLASGQSHAASQLYDGTTYQWHLVGQAASIVDGAVSINFDPAVDNIGSGATYGAYCRVPPQDAYAVAVNTDLSTYGSHVDNTFNVSLSNTPIGSRVASQPSGQFSWGGDSYAQLSTDTTPAFLTASGLSQDQPIYLNAYLSVFPGMGPQRSSGTLDPQVGGQLTAETVDTSGLFLGGPSAGMITGDLPHGQQAYVPLSNESQVYGSEDVANALIPDSEYVNGAGVPFAIPNDKFLLPVKLTGQPGATYSLTMDPGIRVLNEQRLHGADHGGEPDDHARPNRSHDGLRGGNPRRSIAVKFDADGSGVEWHGPAAGR